MVIFSRQRILCHGTKFNVPNRHRFWNDLYKLAHARFFLVGKTNKSWITKNTEQSAAFGGALIRIIQNGGDVRILSDDGPKVVADTIAFIDEFIVAEARKLPQAQQEALRQRLGDRFVYATSRSSHYRAVVSDERLVFIPSLNSAAFRDDALVFELSQQRTPFEFYTYMSDIDRMFDEESTRISLSWQW